MLTILQGDALTKLRELSDQSVQCCVTSPPYWGLRDYGTAEWEGGDDDCDHLEPQGGQDCGKCGAKRIDSQLGLEKTPEEYVAKMVEVFREVRRVLRKDGTLWLNLGDSYAGGGNNSGNTKEISEKQGSNRGNRYEPKPVLLGLKPKDLCGIPWRVAFALQADGWYLRSDVIWSKKNPMPESVTDRPTKSHEYLFLLTKSASYFYDAEAIKEKLTDEDRQSDQYSNTMSRLPNGTGGNFVPGGYKRPASSSRNKRSVWTVATAPYPEAHFATYPPDLIKPCIMAGTSAKGCCAKCGSPWERQLDRKAMVIARSERTHELGRTRSSGTIVEPAESKTIGWQPTCKCDKPYPQFFHDTPCVPCTVLDPFAGSGTTGEAALELGHKAILIEVNPKYAALIETRCTTTIGLPLC